MSVICKIWAFYTTSSKKWVSFGKNCLSFQLRHEMTSSFKIKIFKCIYCN